MSLNWDSTECDPPLAADATEEMNREFLIWSSLTVAIGEISEETEPLWFARLKLAEERGDWKIGMDDVELIAVLRRWRGLRVNVTTLGDQAWLKRRMVSDKRRLRTWKASYVEVAANE